MDMTVKVETISAFDNSSHIMTDQEAEQLDLSDASDVDDPQTATTDAKKKKKKKKRKLVHEERS